MTPMTESTLEATSAQSGDVQSAINAGLTLAAAQYIEGNPYTVVPIGSEVKDLSHLLEMPRRISETVEALDLASFLGYLSRFADETTTVFANPTTSTLRAVLDYHDAAKPSWCAHHLTYTCPLSLEWQAWKANSGRMLPLADFADHIERNLPDIVAPDAATVLEISRGLSGKKDVKFTTSQRLEDGSFQLAYEENVAATSAKGNHKVPPMLTLGLRPYIGAEPFQIDARLRYRVADGGALLIGYELVRPERVLETKFAEICAQVAAGGWAVLQATRK